MLLVHAAGCTALMPRLGRTHAVRIHVCYSHGVTVEPPHTNKIPPQSTFRNTGNNRFEEETPRHK